MSSSQNFDFAPRGKYTIGKEIEPGVHVATCEMNREQYVAQPLSAAEGVKNTLLLWKGQSGVMLKSLLNHENLVSMIDITKTGSGDDAPEHILWDFCDAGNLHNLLVEPEWFPRNNNTYFYPEAFVWHFLVSTLRALAYLHEGYRDYFDVSTGTKKPYKPDVDWFPVLHRNITAENVYFCHPKGKETFGLCKLGNFSRAFVSGHVSGHRDEGLPEGAGTPIAPSTKLWAGLDQMKIFTKMPGGAHNTLPWVPDRLRPYTTGSDQAAVARLALHLMRGKPTPSSGKCPECCCVHLSTFNNPRDRKYNVDCIHGCTYGDLNLAAAHNDPDKALDYSSALVTLVEDLVDRDGTGNQSSSDLYERAYREHRKWMVETEEGNIVTDIEHELRRRWGEAQNKFDVA